MTTPIPAELATKLWRFKDARTTCSWGADAGGERAAAFYGLMETAKLNRLDPADYLRQLFGRIAEHPNNCFDELLPWINDRQLRPTLSELAAASPRGCSGHDGP